MFWWTQGEKLLLQRGFFWQKLEVQNPEELMKVLLDNPSARSQLNSFVEQAIAKSRACCFVAGLLDN